MAKKVVTKNNRKTIYFRIIAILLPLSIFIIAEIGLRLSSYGVDLNLFVEHRVENYDDFYMVNPYVGEKYFNRFNPTKTTIDIFFKEKPSNGFRIFVMGSSTIYGFPYNKNLMASRILHKRLQDAYPDKNIEVVNTAITAINSVTLRDYIDQILDYEPDAILFYAGHNEFYGAFGVGSNETMSKIPFLQRLHFNLMNFRLYQFLRSSIGSISKEVTSGSVGIAEEGTLMKRIVKDPDIVFKGEKYNAGIDQFENNLSYIIDAVKSDEIPLFISDLVSNVKDLPPFGEVGDKSLSSMDMYQQGENALSNGDSILAKKLFYEAKDRDPIRFRASEEINEIIYKLAEENGSILVPTKEKFTEASPDRIIGNNLMSEHVHPNIDGQFLLADAFYNKIVESKLIDTSTNPYTRLTKEYYRHNWGYSALDSLIGLYNVKQLKSHWPFTSLESNGKFRKTFKPNGMVESLAFSTITKPDTEIETLHNILAGYYRANNKLDLALKEYEALIGINPTFSSYYNQAANFLFELGDLNASEKYLKESLKYVKTYFAYYKLGEIEFIKHNYKNVIKNYKSALEIADKEKIDVDQQNDVLRKLYTVYQLINDQDSMNRLEAQLALKSIEVETLQQPHEFEYSKYVPHNIKGKFNKALAHFTTNIDSSLYYLKVCLKINDCPLVNLAIGDVLSQKRDTSCIFFYRKAYDAFSKEPNFLSRFCAALIANNNKGEANEVLEELVLISPYHNQVPILKQAINK